MLKYKDIKNIFGKISFTFDINLNPDYMMGFDEDSEWKSEEELFLLIVNQLKENLISNLHEIADKEMLSKDNCNLIVKINNLVFTLNDLT